MIHCPKFPTLTVAGELEFLSDSCHSSACYLVAPVIICNNITKGQKKGK